MTKRTSTALKIVAIVIAVVLFSVLGLAAGKPPVFKVERSTVINAPPDKILPHLQDFHAWSGWSPYEKLDPNMKRSFSGPEKGKGAQYAWEGDKSGSGRMEILDASAAKVAIQLDFTKPMEGHNLAAFTLEPKGDSTKVTWSMQGPNQFVGKIFQVFVNMDRMIGADFESGLANLKTLAEK